MRRVQKQDSGLYWCAIQRVSNHVKVAIELIVMPGEWHIQVNVSVVCFEAEDTGVGRPSMLRIPGDMLFRTEYREGDDDITIPHHDHQVALHHSELHASKHCDPHVTNQWSCHSWRQHRVVKNIIFMTCGSFPGPVWFHHGTVMLPLS